MKETKVEILNIEKRVAELQEVVRESNHELSTLAKRLVETRAIHAAETAKAEEVRFKRLRVELSGHLADLDKQWSPATERKVIEIFSQFRQARKSGQSWEALNGYIEKLKNPSGGRSPRRSWSALIDWVPQQENAA
jgi:hypothetical protein